MAATDRAAATRKRNPPGQGSRLRGDIVDAAIRLLSQGTPASSLSLRAVAREAEVTAPAIYPHFATMDEILAAVVARRFEEFTAVLDSAVAAVGPQSTPRARLAARVLAYCRFGVERPIEYDLLFGRNAAFGRVVYEKSAGESAFSNLTAAVAAVRPDADAFALSAVLWPALHGLVRARVDLDGFPWPPIEGQVEFLIDRIVGEEPSP